MLRHASQAIVSSNWAIACVLALAMPLARAQTIADYSRAQSAWLENTMSQAAARSAALGASAPTLAAPAALVASTPPPRMTMPVPASAPAIQVSGVFASGAGAVAEVMVNATAYLLGVGQGVPGTAWHVESVAIDKVVLSRPGGSASSDSPGQRRVYALPALR